MLKASIPGLGLSAAMVLGLAGVSEGATFYNVAEVDLSSTSVAANPEFIGTNPAFVAWDGTNAFVAGFNASAGASDTAIVKVSNVLTSPTIGPRFGVQTAIPANRGFSGLDLRKTAGVTSDLAATTDPGTAGTQRLFMYNADGSERWNFTPGARPPTGPAFDLTVGRVSHMYQGSGLIRNNNPADGSNTGTPNSNNSSVTATTAYRDIDFNETTGDAWTRENNDVIRSTRTGAATYAATALKAADLTNANTVGQSIQYLTGIEGTDFAVFNDRSVTSAGQAFTTVVKAVDDTGATVSLSFLNADGTASFAPGTGSALYDFSWDRDSQTLGVVDYDNRRLYVFATAPVPEPTSFGVVAAAGGLLALRRRRRA